MRRAALFALLLALAAVPSVRAHDRWDLGTLGNDDSPSGNPNEVAHGASQVHDLEATGSPADQDWIQVAVRARHSYEARVSGTSGVYWSTLDGLPCVAGMCARLDRMDFGGTVLQGASTLEGDNRAAAVRWIAPVTGSGYLRVQGPTGTALGTFDGYQFEFFDTTYAVARFNNSATQITVLVIQNLRAAAVTGNIDFYNAAGTLLHSAPLSVPGAGSLVLNTATLPVAGQSGSVLIAQTGGWGALAGKAVALEPATGFTFDTPLVSMPR
jgi:hypothetical protein